MKTVFWTFFLTLFVTACYGQQKALTFQQAEKSGTRVSHLDSIYASGLHADSTKAVFWDKQTEFIKAYQTTLQDLGKFLKANNFTWPKQTRCFNRIYFNNDGHIDYFLYSFSKGELTEAQETRFNVLLNEFIKDYKFPLAAKTKFSQCSPVTYNN